MYEVGPWSTVDTNGDGVIDTIETRAAARRVYGLTPISEEQQTIDHSWTLNVADNLKDQHTDQFTLNLEREIIKNFSVGATYIYKHTADLFANIPINRETGQEWEYERIPVHDVVRPARAALQRRAQGLQRDGVIDSDDIAWIGDNSTSVVQNMPSLRRHDAQARLPRRPARLPEEVRPTAGRAWPPSCTRAPSGMARRSFRQDFNVEGPMFYDDNWMGNLNYTVNNLEGPLPFTPKWEIKLSGSYTIPKIEVDLGARLRFSTGRPMWKLENYPQHTQCGDPPGGVIDPGGLNQVVSVDPNEPDYLPSLSLLDLHRREGDSSWAGRADRSSSSTGSTSSTPTRPPTSASSPRGTAGSTNIPQGRRFRGGLRFQF